MSLVLAQTLTALIPGLTSSFATSGGTPPYSYAVRANGAGGTIDSTGLYTAPAQVGVTPETLYDTVIVTDSSSPALFATSQILVGTPLMLLCDIIQIGMNLASGRVYLWNQKIMQPTDFGLYVAVSVPMVKAFANNTSYDSQGNAVQTVNAMAKVDIDIISRGPAARDQKELVLAALQSPYSESQQEANSFTIGRLPAGGQFLNLSQVDGAAIPYRYKISVNMLYCVEQVQAAPYFDYFYGATVYTNP